MDLLPGREAALTLPVARHFAALGYRVRAEVDVNGRLADLVCVKDDEVVGVELKLADWRAAHRQATAYQLGCHRAYVALPLLVAARVAASHRAAFERDGVGLLAVNHPHGDVRELVPCGANARFLPFLAQHLASGPS